MPNPGSVPPATSRISPLPPEPYDRDATVDIPLDSGNDMKAKERELQAREAVLRRKEQELKRREDAIQRAGIVIEEKNWPPFFPIIHHDIAKEVPIHLQRVQYILPPSFCPLPQFNPVPSPNHQVAGGQNQGGMQPPGVGGADAMMLPYQVNPGFRQFATMPNGYAP